MIREWKLVPEGHSIDCAKKEMEGWVYDLTDYAPKYIGYCTCKEENIKGDE